MGRNFYDGYTVKNIFQHQHEFCGVTEFADRHQHEFNCLTVKTLGRGLDHYHLFEGIASNEDGHAHTLYGQTGTAIVIDAQNHTHAFEGKSSVNYKHNHLFNGIFK